MNSKNDSEDTYRVALAQAAENLGGPAPLAQRLQVSTAQLTRWLDGLDQPSIGTFLKVVDILAETSKQPRLTPRPGPLPH